MADVYLTMEQLETIFCNLTATMLGFDLTLTENASKVRISWQTYGAPAWKIDEDVTFIRILPLDNEYDKIRDVKFSYLSDSTLNKTTSRTRVFQVMWTLYGPNSFTNAETIRDELFNDTASYTLDQNNIYMITEVPEITRAPEQFASQWWERCDLSVTFNGLITKNSTVYSIASVPIATETLNSVNSKIITMD